MKKNIIVVAVIAVAAATAGFYFNDQSENASQIKLFGNVDIRQVSLAFTQSERVTAVNVEEGDQVHQGDVIATLDATLLQLNVRQSDASIAAQQALVTKLEAGSRKQEVSQANAAVDELNAQVNLAESRLQRILSVQQQTNGRGVSQQDIDDASTQLASLKASLARSKAAQDLVNEGPRQEDIMQAKAQLEVLKANHSVLIEQLNRTQLISPTDAVVRSRLLEPGDMASPQRAVVTLALTTPKWVRVYISEPNLPRIHLGDQVQVSADGIPNGPISGTIGYISSVAEFTPKNVQTEELRTALVYEVRVRVNDPDSLLKLGMPATVVIDL